MRDLRGVVISVALLVGGCAMGAPRHPEFKSRHPKIRTIGVPTPHAEAYRLNFKGDKDMLYDLLPAMRHAAQTEAVEALTKRGYTVKVLDMEESSAKQAALAASLHTVQELLSKRLEQHRKKLWKTPKSFRYSVGSEINPLADAAGSDVIVLVRCLGMKKTTGEVTKDWMKTVALAAITGSVAVPYMSATIIQVAVIDGNTGDILWSLDNAQQPRVDPADERDLRKAVGRMVSRFPKAKSPATPRTTPAPAPADPAIPPAPTVPAGA